VTNELQSPEALTARAAEVRKALIIALDVITWPEIIEIQIEVARELEHDLMGCLLEACLNMANELYGQGDSS
jgi:hypothetical protein